MRGKHSKGLLYLVDLQYKDNRVYAHRNFNRFMLSHVTTGNVFPLTKIYILNESTFYTASASKWAILLVKENLYTQQIMSFYKLYVTFCNQKKCKLIYKMIFLTQKMNLSDSKNESNIFLLDQSNNLKWIENCIQACSLLLQKFSHPLSVDKYLKINQVNIK